MKRSRTQKSGHFFRRYQRQIVGGLRVILGAGLAFSLVHATLKWTGADLWQAFSHPRSPLLIFCLCFHGLIIGMTSTRWKVLLRVQGIHLTIFSAVRLSLMGFFFSLALPGSVSGDILKMSFVARRTQDKKAEAMLTVMLDRLFGVFGLFIVATFTVLLSLPFLLALSPEYRLIQIAALLVGIGSLFAVLSLTLLHFHPVFLRFSRINRMIHRIARKMPAPFAMRLTRLLNATGIYHRHPKAVLSVLGLSLIIHSCLALNLFCVGIAIGEETLGIRDYFLATQVANAVAAVPLTPGGIGTRDATIALFFNAMQAVPDKVGLIPVVMTVILVFWGVIGGIFFIFSKSPESANVRKFSHEASDTYGIRPNH